MADALVAVDEGVIRHERKSQGGCFVDERGMKVDASKVALGCASAASCRSRSRIPAAPPDWASTRRCSVTTSPSVRYASGEAAGQLDVLAQHPVTRGVKRLVRRSEEISHRGPREVEGETPNRSASSRSFSACASESSKATFMPSMYSRNRRSRRAAGVLL